MTRRRNNIVSQDQGRLPFGSHGKGGILAYATPFERGVLMFSVSAFILSVVLYMYFVMASVAHVAARGALEQDVALLSADVAQLESQYFAQSEGITEAFARAHGFVSISKSAYVERASLVTLKDSR